MARGAVPGGMQEDSSANETERQVKDRFCRFLLEFRKARNWRRLSSASKPHGSVGADSESRYLYVDRLRSIVIEETLTLRVDFRDIEQFDPELALAIELEYYRFEPSVRAGAALAMNEVKARTKGVVDEEEGPPDMGQQQLFVALTGVQKAARKLRELNSSCVGRLVVAKGTVTRTSDVRPELLYGSFTCLKCGLTKADVEQQLRYTTPTICSNKQCNNSSLVAWNLEIERSTFSDWQRIRVQESPDEIPAGSLPRSFDVIVRDAMVERVKAGDKLEATGVLCVMPDSSGLARAGETAVAQRMTGDLSQGVTGTRLLGCRELTYKLVFVACSIEPVGATVGAQFASKTAVEDAESEEENDDDSNEDLENVRLTKTEARKIVANMKAAPQLYDNLAASIAPTIYGHADIKRGVLLQLVGGLHKRTPEGIKLRGDINVCIVGDPSTAKSQFLKYVHAFSPRAVYTSGKAASAAGLTASIVRDVDTGEFCVEAGALMLADNGICCFPAEDHQLLTNRGFMFLDDVLNCRNTIQFASYDPNRKEIRYEQARRIIVNDGMQDFVDITDKREAIRWAKFADLNESYENEEMRVDAARSTRVSIVATANHDMYIMPRPPGWQSTTDAASDDGHVSAFVKTKAGCIAKGGSLSTFNLLAFAEEGIHTPKESRDLHLIYRMFCALGLDNNMKQLAFLECVGLWLRTGSLCFSQNGTPDCVRFFQRRQEDVEFLVARLEMCSIQIDYYEIAQVRHHHILLDIREPRWMMFFFGEYWRICECASPCATAPRPRKCACPSRARCNETPRIKKQRISKDASHFRSRRDTTETIVARMSTARVWLEQREKDSSDEKLGTCTSSIQKVSSTCSTLPTERVATRTVRKTVDLGSLWRHGAARYVEHISGFLSEVSLQRIRQFLIEPGNWSIVQQIALRQFKAQGVAAPLHLTVFVLLRCFSKHSRQATERVRTPMIQSAASMASPNCPMLLNNLQIPNMVFARQELPSRKTISLLDPRGLAKRVQVDALECDEYPKWLPWWALCLSKEPARAIIRGYSLADTCQSAQGRMFTSSACFRDELVILALHAGFSARFKMAPPYGTASNVCAVNDTWEISYMSDETKLRWCAAVSIFDVFSR